MTGWKFITHKTIAAKKLFLTWKPTTSQLLIDPEPLNAVDNLAEGWHTTQNHCHSINWAPDQMILLCLCQIPELLQKHSQLFRLELIEASLVGTSTKMKVSSKYTYSVYKNLLYVFKVRAHLHLFFTKFSIRPKSAPLFAKAPVLRRLGFVAAAAARFLLLYVRFTFAFALISVSRFVHAVALLKVSKVSQPMANDDGVASPLSTASGSDSLPSETSSANGFSFEDADAREIAFLFTTLLSSSPSSPNGTTCLWGATLWNPLFFFFRSFTLEGGHYLPLGLTSPTASNKEVMYDYMILKYDLSAGATILCFWYLNKYKFWQWVWKISNITWLWESSSAFFFFPSINQAS